MGNIIKTLSEAKPLIKEIKGLVNTVRNIKPASIGTITPKKIIPRSKEAKQVMLVSRPTGSKLLLTDANQTTETTKGLSLDRDLGEIMGRTRLALKNMRDYYHGSQFRTRLKRAGFNEEESDLAVKEIDEVLERSAKRGIHVGESLYFDSAKRNPSATGVSSTYGNSEGKYAGSSTQVFTNRALNIEDFIGTLFHEYGGHTSTASIGHHLGEKMDISEFPMIKKMIDYNRSLPLRLKEWDVSPSGIEKLISVNDKGNAVFKPMPLKDFIKITSLPSEKLYAAIEERFPNLSSTYNINAIITQLLNIRNKTLFYLTTPTEVRARAFQEATGNPGRAVDSDIFNTVDWNAYLSQFLKKGAKLLPRKS